MERGRVSVGAWKPEQYLKCSLFVSLLLLYEIISHSVLPRNIPYVSLFLQAINYVCLDKMCVDEALPFLELHKL